MSYQTYLPGYVNLTPEQEKVLETAAEILKKDGYTGPLNFYSLINRNNNSLNSETGISIAVATIVTDTFYQNSMEKISNFLLNVSSVLVAAVVVFGIVGLTSLLC